MYSAELVLFDSSSIPQSEWNSLQDLYTSTRGQDWAWGQQQGIPWNFTSDANPCVDGWEGVVCSAVQENGFLHVDQLQLSHYNLEGSLPESIGNLTQLTVLNLTSNLLSGAPLPSSIDDLQRLQVLELDHCHIMGPIPRTMCGLMSLRILNLEANDMTGSLYPVCCLTRIEHLNIAFADLNGTLPACLGNLTMLQTVMLEYNGFSGSIPESIGRLQQLTYLNIGLNNLSGKIPDTFRHLTSIQALLLVANFLTGTLPGYITTFSALENLEVAQNQFTGSVPAQIGDLTSLRLLSLQNNLFNGTLPASLTKAATLAQFNAEANFLTGTLPAGFDRLPRLQAFDIRANQLSGTVPAEILAIQTLRELFLQYNDFTGTLPDVVSPDTALAALLVNRNRFTGTLPGTVLKASKLVVLDVSENLLTGTFPSIAMNNGSNLFFLSAGINYLTGTFPAFDVSCGQLAYLNMSTNYLSGTIPISIGELSSLNFLYFYSNLLDGSLPDVWGNLQGLSYLTADGNLLSGTIPASLGDAARLQSLNLSYNHLTGAIPASLFQLEDLSVLLLMNNALTGSVNDIIDPDLQRNLTTLQVSNNQLTGPLPEDLNLLPALKVFAAVSNCFTGSIPLSLCESKSLETLALDGLQAATSCQQRLFPAALEGTVVANSLYAIRSPFVGGVPACLFSMQNITTLHLSGNELTGPLPSDLELGPLLLDLSLSHNKLTGTIPAALLRRNWRNLDLSYNVFVGSLDGSVLTTYESSTAFDLGNNRLSGVIPSAFADLVNVNVLESNLFSCRADRSDLPANDPNHGKYDCASTNFDYSLYAWLALAGSAALTVSLLRGPFRRSERCVTVTEQVQRWISVSAQDTPHYAEVTVSVKRALWLSVASAAYIILLLLPIYAGCTALYGTYTHQYAYAISAAYLSGPVPFAWEFVFLFLLWFGIAAVSVAFRMSRNSLPCDRESSSGALPALGVRRRSLAVYALTALLNFAVVLGVNMAYVIIALNKNGLALTVTQIALALFKVAFNSLCSPALLRWTSQRFTGRQPSPASFITVQLVVSIVNNILVPCLVVSIVSPNCFYNIFRTAAKVDTHFTYAGKCLTYSPFSDLQFSCIEEAVAVADTSYSPPFDYSYQCSSSFITYYAPAYVIMCIIAGFALPVAQVVLQRLHARAAVGTRWFAVLDVVLPRILKPISLYSVDGTVMRNFYVPIFDASQHLITLLTYLALLMTYGAVFPPLAVCFTASMGVMVLFTKLKVGRFLVSAREANQPGQVAIVEQECAGVGEPGILLRAVSMIAVSAGVFYTLFLFDTLGDRWGLQYAFWVLMVTPLVAPLVLVMIRFICTRHVDTGANRPAVLRDCRTDIELSEVSSGTVSPLTRDVQNE